MPNLSNGFEAFLNKLELPLAVVQKIEQAQAIIEAELKSGLELFSASKQGGGVKITPKFIPQGSKVYRTLNYPCHTPPQQVDFDYGVYLPVSYHANNGEPSIAALEYFAQVDTILDRVARSRGWVIDRSKKTCTRLIIDNLIHIDIPLYSIPDVEFQRITKAMESERLVKNSRGETFQFDNEIEFWDNFAIDKVLLCRREGRWIPSDPRKIAKAFREAISKHGEQLRRVWRYLKAWRDNLWPNGNGPSSIYLMFGALKTYKAAMWRDDIGLHSALQAFLTASSTKVLTNEGEDLAKNQKPEELVALERAANSFSSELAQAINLSEEDGRAERIVVQHLGNRFPIPDKPKNPGNMPEQEKIDLIQRHHAQQPVGRPHFKNA